MLRRDGEPPSVGETGGWRRLQAARAARDPAWALAAARAVARARLAFRGCQVGPRARLYGRCRVLRGGVISLGSHFRMTAVTVPCELLTLPGGRIEIGDHVYFNYGCSVSAHHLVRIGSGCMFGQYTMIMDSDQHSAEDHLAIGDVRPVVIGDHVWTGTRVTILKGVTIGSGSTVAAGSVVTRDVPPGVVVGGVPARIMRSVRRAGEQ